MTRNLPFIACLLFLAAAQDAAAQPRCGKATTSARVFREGHRTLLGIALGQSSLDAVQERLGKARVLTASTGAMTAAWLCYSSSRQDDATTVLFEDGGVGGLVGFHLLAHRPAHFRPEDCTPSPLVHRDLATAGDIRLGMASSTLRRRLGQSPKELRKAKVGPARIGDPAYEVTRDNVEDQAGFSAGRECLGRPGGSPARWDESTFLRVHFGHEGLRSVAVFFTATI